MRLMQISIGLILVMTIFCIPASARPLVLAHYMPGFAKDVHYVRRMSVAESNRGKGVADAPLLAQTFFSGPTPWGRGLKDFAKYEIQTAIHAGIDGFVFDYGAGYGGSKNIGLIDIPHVSLPVIDAFFAVAEKSFGKFRLALALDEAEHGGDVSRRRATIRQFLLRHAHSPVLLRENGRPVFFSYRASALQPFKWPGRVRNEKAFIGRQKKVIRNWKNIWSTLHIHPYFVADLPNAWEWKHWGVSDKAIKNVLSLWAHAFDGLSVFGVTDRLDQAKWLYPIMGSVCRSEHKLFVAPIWWGYHPERGRILMQGADMALKTWSIAKQSGADWVIVNTWNDFSEQSDWAPSINHGYALIDILRTYSHWFKSGIFRLPSIPDVIVFYRRFSLRPILPRLSGIVEWLPLDNTIDVVTISRTPGSLSINGHIFVVNAGIESHRVPLKDGPVSATFHYGHKSVTVRGLAPVISHPKRDIYGTYIASSNFEPELNRQLGEYGTSKVQRRKLKRWRLMIKKLINPAVDLDAIH